MSGAIVAMGGGGFSEEPDNPLAVWRAHRLDDALRERSTRAPSYRVDRRADGAAIEPPLPTRYLWQLAHAAV